MYQWNCSVPGDFAYTSKQLTPRSVKEMYTRCICTVWPLLPFLKNLLYTGDSKVNATDLACGPTLSRCSQSVGRREKEGGGGYFRMSLKTAIFAFSRTEKKTDLTGCC